MTIQIMPGIRQIEKHLNRGSKEAVLGPTMPQIPAQAPAHEEIDLEGKNKGIIADPYTFALAAMPLLDDRIKFSSFTTITGQPIENLREWLVAVEAGQWPEG